MSEAEEYFKNNTVTRDFFPLICGDMLGEGSGRSVFDCKLDPTIVIKFETGSRQFQNVMEWSVWERVCCVIGVKDWFCPCVSISACGTVLIQKKAANARAKELPTRVPAYFTDFKVENWGIYNGKPVIRDYGTHLMLENGMTKRMKSVDWGN